MTLNCYKLEFSRNFAHDSSIFICFILRKVKAVIAPTLRQSFIEWNPSDCETENNKWINESLFAMDNNTGKKSVSRKETMDNNSVAHLFWNYNDLSRSSKVIDFGTSRKRV